MEGSLTESVQQLVRPGKCLDVYYPDPETAGKQCFRTSQNTRYVQAFNNLSGGSQTLTIPPNNGIQDVVVVMGLPTTFTTTGMGVNRGWGYALINKISFRYGGSSQYFLSGQQVLQAALSQAADGTSRDALLQLGGNASQGADFATAQYAYVWLPLPHTIPTAEGKLPPIPSDLLTQQIQITVELNPIASIFSYGSSGALANAPTSLAFGEFVVQQVLLENQGDALARRVDMSSHALSYPITFRQQEVVIPLSPGQSVSAGTSQSVTLTGFRSGEVKEIHVWLTADSANTPAQGGSTCFLNPFLWYAPTDITMTYAGEIYARFDKEVSQLFNLVNGRIPSQVNDVQLQANGTAVGITSAVADKWAVLPFGQSYDPLTAHSMYMAGKPITNGIVNLTFSIPPSWPSGGSTATLHVSYVYNAVLTFSQGTCDYVF